jgi:hypothetical protein
MQNGLSRLPFFFLPLGLRIPFLMLVCCGQLSAQSPILPEANSLASAAEDEQYGLKVGANFAELWGADALPESDRKLGYSFGLYAAFKLRPGLKLQTELIWSLQGEKSPSSGRYKISYLNVPVLLKWESGRWHTALGPQLGFLTISMTQTVPAELRLAEFERIDLSAQAEIGYRLAADWSLSLRYGQGFTNLVAGKDLKNSVLYVGVAHRIF